MRVSFALKQQQKLQKEKIVADKEAVMWYTSFSVPYYGFCHRWKVQLFTKRGTRNYKEILGGNIENEIRNRRTSECWKKYIV